MEIKRKSKQRILQACFGIGLILFVVLIELFAIQPPGIYSYTRQGYENFKIGFSKEQVLQEINKQKTIRTIRVCGPENVFELTSRKPFDLEKDMILSEYWLCPDRTGKFFLFLFKQGILERILVQKLGFGKKQALVFFVKCDLECLNNIDACLAAIKTQDVFHDTKK